MKERDKRAANSSSPGEQPKDAEPNIQGEGDYAADRRYRERTDQFLKSADVEEVARAAAPKSKAEADDMAAAEEEGRSHAHLPPKRGATPRDKPRRGPQGK
jgi:hypothetical protein